MTPQRQGAEQRTPLHVVRIVRGQAEDAETYGNGRPGAWLGIALVFAIVFFAGLHVPLLWVRP